MLKGVNCSSDSSAGQVDQAKTEQCCNSAMLVSLLYMI